MCMPSGRTLVAEGAPFDAYYLTINGAVEKVLARGDRRYPRRATLRQTPRPYARLTASF